MDRSRSKVSITALRPFCCTHNYNDLSSSLVIYSKLVSTPTTIYAIGLAKSLKSYTLHVTTLSASTGELITSIDIPSSITSGPSSVLPMSILQSQSEHQLAPRIAWIEEGTLRSVQLSPELKDRPAVVKGATYRDIINIGLAEHGIFVAVKSDGSGRVVRLAEEGLKVIWEFAESVSRIALKLYA